MSKIIKFVAMQDSPLLLEHPPLQIECDEADAACVANHMSPEQLKELEMNIVEAAQEKARHLLEQTNIEIANQLATAKTEAEALRQQAQQAGFDQGYQAGLQQGQNAGKQEWQVEIERTVAQTNRLAEELQKEAERVFLEAEQEIIAIALATAQKILLREIDDNPMTVLPIVRSALEKVRDQEKIVIRVHPDDYELLLQAKRDLQMIIGREQALNLVADQTIGRGGCMIDTMYGTVDAKIDTQFETIKKMLQEVEV